MGLAGMWGTVMCLLLSWHPSITAPSLLLSSRLYLHFLCHPSSDLLFIIHPSIQPASQPFISRSLPVLFPKQSCLQRTLSAHTVPGTSLLEMDSNVSQRS